MRVMHSVAASLQLAMVLCGVMSLAAADRSGGVREVTVVRPDGSPVEKASVRWFAPGQKSDVPGRLTGKKGTVRLEGRGAGELGVEKDAVRLLVRLDRVQWPLRIILPAPAAGSSGAGPMGGRVTVVNALGQPIEGAVVRWSFMSVRPEAIKKHHTSAKGAVSLPVVKSGPIGLYIDADGCSLQIPNSHASWPLQVVLPIRVQKVDSKQLMR